MRLLVTNDDGVASPGLWALADAMRDAGHDVAVVAPAEERSGSGAAIGHIIPGEGVIASPVERPGWETAAWAVDGAPALCVLLALRHAAFGGGFQAVVSGINPGWNTSQGVIHSGTVGAVLTGGVAGLPGVAVSIDAPTAQVGEVGLVAGIREHWATAATLAVEAVGWLGRPESRPDGGGPPLVNLNVPNRPLARIRGVRPASLAPSTSSAIRRQPSGVDGDGRLRLVLGPPTVIPTPGSDNDLLPEGWATVTLLTGVGHRAEDGGAGEAARRLGALVEREAQPT